MCSAQRRTVAHGGSPRLYFENNGYPQLMSNKYNIIVLPMSFLTIVFFYGTQQVGDLPAGP